MAYAPYLVELPITAPRVNGIRSCVVWADSVADAKLLAKGASGSESDDNHWANATVTQIQAGSDWEGWTLEVTLGDGPNKQVWSFTGGPAATLDDLGAGVEALIDDTYASSSYTSATNILQIPSSHNVGDRNRSARLHKNGATAALLAVSASAVGAAASNVDFTLPADATVVPMVQPCLQH